MSKKHNFYMSNSLNVDVYDQINLSSEEPLIHDVGFYIEQAKELGGSVLELGCGTGRVTWEMADAGIEIVGLDLSEHMLNKAESKNDNYSTQTQDRISFIKENMIDFNLGREFNLIIIPFRSWMVILDPYDQRKSLECIHRHLTEFGTLIIDNFDPRLEFLLPGDSDRSHQVMEANHPVTGNRVEVQVIEHVNDSMKQILTEVWQFTERDDNGCIFRQEDEILSMRWTYRWEMRYLLELTGFTIENEFSDFLKSPSAYGKEQIWIVNK